MRIAIAGAHGQIGLRLGRLLAARGEEVVGIVRNPDHSADLEAAGIEAAVVDLESSSADEVGSAIDGCDAVVFAAGAGPASGIDRKDTVDRAAAILLADAAERAGVGRYVLVSSMGVDSVRDGATPDGVDEVMVAYLRAKLAAEDDVRGRELRWTILRPGRLTDDDGTGQVQMAEHVDRGDIPRDDVASVVAALLDDPSSAGHVLEVVSGGTPVGEAVTQAVRG
ncbi:SDR family oxidoreductase [Angustibacter sp. Root456]|uniref:SDR family oxidoreductase n=1 Tax=Angustibacter sp. Root456 TaxID=1736539 RepID=UPI000701ED65|nr:SDR family oxidoreductase [Angustibacter sp. Root456]KQX68604.1 NAD-dependent dehydratase [Angustibacter sp. Root456]